MFSHNERIIFGNLTKLCRKGCHNCFLGVPRKFLTFFFWKKITIFWRTRGENFPFGRKLIVAVVKTRIYVSIATFWWQKTFLGKYDFFTTFKDFQRPFFGLLLEFWLSCQKCNLRVRRKIFMTKYTSHINMSFFTTFTAFEWTNSHF